MKIIRNIFGLFAFVFLSACDVSVYTTGRGVGDKLYLVNKFTGTVSEVHQDAVIPVPTVTATKTDATTLAEETIPQKPIQILGSIKYVDGEMLVKVKILPLPNEVDSSRMEEWRTYIDYVRTNGANALNLRFYDSDYFFRTSHKIEVSEMQRTVDSDGRLDSLDFQDRIPMSPSTFAAIKGWTVGWNGYWGTWMPKPKAPIT